MELFGRRWDRWDAIVVAATVTLVVVSNRPWWALHADTAVANVPSPEGLVIVWNAWRHWQWSGAVALGTLAAGLHLAYRGRPEAKGAAWLAVFMVLGAVGLVGWQWHRASDIEVKDLSGRILTTAPPDEPPEDYRRRMKELEASMRANAGPLPTRSTPRSGIYVAASSLILMFAASARGLVRSQETGPGS